MNTSEEITFMHSDLFEHDGALYLAVYAWHGKQEVGRCGFRITDKSLIPDDFTEVDSEYQRLGIATAMYRWAEVLMGRKVRPSQSRTWEARMFWKTFAKKQDWRKPAFVFRQRPIRLKEQREAR